MDPFTALIIAIGAAWATLGRGLTDIVALARGQTPPSVARRQGKNDLERERIRAAQAIATSPTAGGDTGGGGASPSGSDSPTRQDSTPGQGQTTRPDLSSAASLEPRRIRVKDVVRHRWEDFLEEKDQRLRERHLSKPERKQRRKERHEQYLRHGTRGWASHVLDSTEDAQPEPEEPAPERPETPDPAPDPNEPNTPDEPDGTAPEEPDNPEALEPEAGPDEEAAEPNGDPPEEPTPNPEPSGDGGPEPSGQEPDSLEGPAHTDPEEEPAPQSAPESDESPKQHQPEEEADSQPEQTAPEEVDPADSAEPASSNTPDPDSSLGQVIALHPNQDSSAPSTTQGDTAMATTTDGEISGYADALDFTQRMEEESAQAARVFEDNAEALTSYQLPQNIIADIHAAHDAAEEMRQALGRARQELERQRDVAEAVETAGGSQNIARDTSFYDDN